MNSIHSKLFLFITCLSLSLILRAQETKSSGDDSWKKVYRATATKYDDLINTKLDVKFDYDKSYMYGKEWVTLHPHFYPTDSLTLDAKGMNINEISLVANGKKTPLQYKYDDSMFLRIQLNKTY